jgi:hypothetical protein
MRVITIYFHVITKSGPAATQDLFEKVPVFIDLLLHELGDFNSGTFGRNDIDDS